MNTVTMYTTRVCPFCIRAKGILKLAGVTQIIERNAEDAAVRDEMIEKTNCRTVPQIFIGEVYVGGCSDLERLHSQGKLKEMLGIE